MECVRRNSNYIYHTYPQVFFNSLDHCFYQFVEVEKSTFNTSRFEALEQCNSSHVHCYLNEVSDKLVSLRFSLFQSSISVNHFVEEKNAVTPNQLCKIFLHLVETVALLHSSDSFHGDLSVNSVFLDPTLCDIALGSFPSFCGKFDIQSSQRSDLENLPIIALRLVNGIKSDSDAMDLINKLKQNNKESIQWLTQKTNSLFVSFLMAYLAQPLLTPESVSKWVGLFDIFVSKWKTVEILLAKYIEFFYLTNTSTLHSVDFVHYIRPFLVEGLSFKTDSPVPHKALSEDFFVDRNCEIYDVHKSVLTDNSFIITNSAFPLKTMFYKLESQEENDVFSQFLQSHLGHGVKNGEVVLPKSLTKDTDEYIITKPTLEIMLHGESTFKLLSIANRLRSKGFIVKCQRRKSEKESQNSWLNVYIENDSNGLCKMVVDNINGKKGYFLDEFIKVITANEEKQLHSMSTRMWASVVARPSLKIKHVYQHSQVTLPKFHTDMRCDFVQRVKSCQIFN
ncbi:hypothetical protein EIN_175840 [Entamoeba invadens IP1]|uniref:hypothetical protein n=1 Tax=Entamoeba invadens IP1 TaxID=370355 RepID=UPI0002C3F76E|nr:hypothetical protein EIN_175840 [Entamoeba invadens IP1]ELP93797.1 hypothetical protein EIN_175840 [Entamoeba invadens IP1]|eukprot:XP_004260568.1 hypothetical protein EIN_175840 [Entamoeba invadens IP1]